jgi:hypothetical protein
MIDLKFKLFEMQPKFIRELELVSHKVQSTSIASCHPSYKNFIPKF